MAVAPRISAATAAELEAARWSWAGFDGEAHVSAPGLVLRALRADPHRAGAASHALVPLVWSNAGRDGVGSRWALVDPTALLDEWAEHQVPPQEVLAHGLISDTDDVIRLLTEVLPAGTWVLAGTSAAERLAPILTASTVVEVAVEPEVAAGLDRLLAESGLRRVERGARVRFLAVARVTTRTSQLVGDTPVTSDVRTYADVLNRPGRGPDAAAEIRRARLAF